VLSASRAAVASSLATGAPFLAVVVAVVGIGFLVLALVHVLNLRRGGYENDAAVRVHVAALVLDAGFLVGVILWPTFGIVLGPLFFITLVVDGVLFRRLS
jgi:hypothetical protein